MAAGGGKEKDKPVVTKDAAVAMTPDAATPDAAAVEPDAKTEEPLPPFTRDMVKFAAGVHFPAHHHDGLETVLLMAGSYTEDSGKRYATGDLHLMEPGTAHSFTIDKDEDCVAATVLHGGLNFRSTPLRWLARVLGH